MVMLTAGSVTHLSLPQHLRDSLVMYLHTALPQTMLRIMWVTGTHFDGIWLKLCSGTSQPYCEIIKHLNTATDTAPL